MSKILVAGLINIETTLQVERFPVEYTPVRYPFFGVRTSVSGVGFNVAAALAGLGDRVDLLSITGRDPAAGLIKEALHNHGISTDYVAPGLEQTAQSVILYDPAGRRMINTDLKDVQEQAYPVAGFERALAGCDLAVLCNINFARPMLEAARAAGKPVATDVHAIARLDSPYDADFMAAADILFMSHERLPCAPEDWAAQLQQRHGTPLIVIGLGAEGALLAVRAGNFMARLPAVQTRPVVSTVGAGDALFAGFVHFYCRQPDPVLALQKAQVLASYKIGAAGGAEGFLDETGLENLYRRLYP